MNTPASIAPFVNLDTRTPLEGTALSRAIRDGLTFDRMAIWPCQSRPTDVEAEWLSRLGWRISTTGDGEVLAEVEEKVLALVTLENGWCYLRTFARDAATHSTIEKRLREVLPETELKPTEVSATFWMLSSQGPRAISRQLAAPTWDDISGNYAGATAAGVENLRSLSFDPNDGGHLILWHGQPGTGKTWAIRGLCREWRRWAALHYIVDPEKFFGNAAYMMEVLLAGSDATPTSAKDDPTRLPMWRLLVLEDTGEMLTKDAKEHVGQGLARMLNVCDGLIGQGLRILILITTNEELGQLHEAVIRPGRCIANVRFDPLNSGEVDRWADRHGGGLRGNGLSVAELFAGLRSPEPRQPAARTAGFRRVG